VRGKAAPAIFFGPSDAKQVSGTERLNAFLHGGPPSM
jgi:hypothetical protein